MVARYSIRLASTAQIAWAKPDAPYTPRNTSRLNSVMFLVAWCGSSDSKGSLLSDQRATHILATVLNTWGTGEGRGAGPWYLVDHVEQYAAAK